MSTVLVDESNPQGIASDDEKKRSYLAALQHEKAGYEAKLKAAERYSDDVAAKSARANLLDVEEEIALVSGVAADEAAAPKRAAAKKATAAKKRTAKDEAAPAADAADKIADDAA